MQKICGGSLCGSVRYVAVGDPLRSHLCHCRDCQRFTGSAFASGLVFPRDAVTITGEVRVFESTAKSGRAVQRHFCPRCGSGVVVAGEGLPDRIVVQIGTLDDPKVYVPKAEIYLDSALPWVHAPNGFPTMAS